MVVSYPVAVSLVVLCLQIVIHSHSLPPDSVIVHGSRLNVHLNGEYAKLLNSSGGEVKRNDRLVYRHECKPLYIYYVLNPIVNYDTVAIEFWIIAPSLHRSGGYAVSEHHRSVPQTIDHYGYENDQWKEYNRITKQWEVDTLVVHSQRTCDSFMISGKDVPENLRGEYVRDPLLMTSLRPVYRRSVPGSNVFLHFSTFKKVWMISADVNGRYAALWLNADCASPDCGVNIKWWKAVLTKEKVNSQCGPARGVVPIMMVVKCMKRTHNVKATAAKTCGQQKLHKVDPVIYRGVTTKPGRWPWMVALWNDASNLFSCSGSLISSRRILTAGHCLRNNFHAILRVHDVHNRATAGSLEYKIRRATRIDNFSYIPNPFSIQNDLMIIELETDVIFDDYVQPLCVPNELDSGSIYLNMPFANVTTPYKNCYTAGWGQNAQINSGEKLLELNMHTMIGMPECIDKKYTSYPWARDKHTSCVYFGKNRKYGKICKGDSGAPLFCQTTTSDSWTVIGVASWVAVICQDVTYMPSVYEDLSHYMKFINNNLY